MSETPVENETPIDTDNLTGHEYDGILEYDNPTPGWWTWLFVLSCVFALFYTVFFHMSVYGWSLRDEYDAEVMAMLRKQFEEIGELEPDRATLVKYMNEPDWLMVGRSVFKTHCVSCHGQRGEGLVGPNLTDEAFKHIRTIQDVARVIDKGAANGAMPAWENRLHVNERVLVSAYVASLRGQNLSGPRPAEGQTIPPWPKPEAPFEPVESKEGAAAP